MIEKFEYEVINATPLTEKLASIESKSNYFNSNSDRFSMWNKVFNECVSRGDIIFASGWKGESLKEYIDNDYKFEIILNTSNPNSDEFKKLTHHIDYLIDFDNCYYDISVSGVEVLPGNTTVTITGYINAYDEEEETEISKEDLKDDLYDLVNTDGWEDLDVNLDSITILDDIDESFNKSKSLKEKVNLFRLGKVGPGFKFTNGKYTVEVKEVYIYYDLSFDRFEPRFVCDLNGEIKEYSDYDMIRMLKDEDTNLVESYKKSKSLKEDKYDYDETSTKDQSLWDTLSMEVADSLSTVFGIDNTGGKFDQDFIKAVDHLVRIVKMYKDGVIAEALPRDRYSKDKNESLIKEDWSKGISFTFKVDTNSLINAMNAGEVEVAGGYYKDPTELFGRTSLRFKDGTDHYMNHFHDDYYYMFTNAYVNFDKGQSMIVFNYYDNDFTYKQFGGKAKLNRAKLTDELDSKLKFIRDALESRGIKVNQAKVEVGGSPRFDSTWRQAQRYNESFEGEVKNWNNAYKFFCDIVDKYFDGTPESIEKVNDEVTKLYLAHKDEPAFETAWERWNDPYDEDLDEDLNQTNNPNRPKDYYKLANRVNKLCETHPGISIEEIVEYIAEEEGLSEEDCYDKLDEYGLLDDLF